MPPLLKNSFIDIDADDSPLQPVIVRRARSAPAAAHYHTDLTPEHSVLDWQRRYVKQLPERAVTLLTAEVCGEAAAGITGSSPCVAAEEPGGGCVAESSIAAPRNDATPSRRMSGYTLRSSASATHVDDNAGAGEGEGSVEVVWKVRLSRGGRPKARIRTGIVATDSI